MSEHKMPSLITDYSLLINETSNVTNNNNNKDKFSLCQKIMMQL